MLNLEIRLISARSTPVETLSVLDKENAVLLTKYRSTLSSFIFITLRANGPELAVNKELVKDGEVKCSKNTFVFEPTATAESAWILPLYP